MKITLLSLFPGIIEPFFQTSIMNRAVERGIVEYQIVDIRDYAEDAHRTCDDYAYGGGAGMVMKPEPLSAALEAVKSGEGRTIFPTPAGKLLTQHYARRLASESCLFLICGRYEGVDQRIIDCFVDDEISIGDYVISSGEIAALVIVDAVYRLLDGVINDESLREESFAAGLLEYPHYTRPETFRERKVPEVLLSGNHALIEAWRYRQSLARTATVRPDMYRRLVVENPGLRDSIEEKKDLQ